MFGPTGLPTGRDATCLATKLKPDLVSLILSCALLGSNLHNLLLLPRRERQVHVVVAEVAATLKTSPALFVVLRPTQWFVLSDLES